MVDKNTTGWLAFLLGGIGVHRFYIGQIGLGFLYLIFCWTFVPAIIGVIDAIVFWTQSDDAFNNSYNKPRQPIYVVNNQATNSSIADEITKYHELKEKGVITQSEFDKKKADLLK